MKKVSFVLLVIFAFATLSKIVPIVHADDWEFITSKKVQG